MTKVVSKDSWNKLPQPIGLLGGSFDPVQNAHVEMARVAIKSGHVQSVVFVPAQQNPLKETSPIASVADRIEMLQCALNDDRSCYISDIEAELPVPSYTIDTVEKIRSLLNKSAQLFFIGGADLLPDFHRWQRAHDIVNLLDGFLVFSRKSSAESEIEKLSSDFSSDELQIFHPLKIDERFKEVSATQFRQMVLSGDSLQTLVPECVLKLIKEKNLYLKKSK